jgi:hypothetical protein
MCMSGIWKRNLCRPPLITPCSILGNGGFALAATSYLSTQLFEIQILNGIFTLIQNPWSFRQRSNNESCSKSYILSHRFSWFFKKNVSTYLEPRIGIELYFNSENFLGVGPTSRPAHLITPWPTRQHSCFISSACHS